MQKRRTFIKQVAIGSLAVGSGLFAGTAHGRGTHAVLGKRIGMIGLDTSHSTAFTDMFNSDAADPALKGYRVVAAYPYGSKTIKSSFERIAGYTEHVKNKGVEIVDSIAELLRKVDVVLLETNDGRLHLEQAREVIAAGKPLFIDKPIAASYADAKAIFDEAARAGVPVFSSSSLRYTANLVRIRAGAVGEVLGADAYSPAVIEPSHSDLFWYGIHGVEMLYAAMGTGCERVSRLYTEGSDKVVGHWEGGRIGTFRGIRDGHRAYGGQAFGTKGIMELGPYDGYMPLLKEIATFFETRQSPVDDAETLELAAFMEAAQRSKERGGQFVELDAVRC